MIQTPNSASSYQANILAALQQTGINNTSPGGKARAFCDAVGDQISRSEASSYSAIAQTLLPYMRESNLDFFGALFDFPRLQRSDVNSSALDNNLEFYVARGTFGSINNGLDIVIPIGTQIYTSAGISGPVLLTVNQITCLASASSVSFAAASLQTGDAGNAAKGTFVAHNFSNYTDSQYGSLLVTNNYGLIGGRDVEDDDSYRYRINLKLQSHGGAAEADLRLAVLAVPGVQDIRFVRQAGTFTCYIYGIAALVPPSLLALTQGQIDDITAFPMVGTALQPDLIGISLGTTLSFLSTTAASDRLSAIANATAAAENYINNLAVGQALVINQIASVIQSSDPNILDTGQPDQPINEIFIWRSRDDGTRYSRYLVADYTPQTGERIITESSIVNPISLTAAN